MEQNNSGHAVESSKSSGSSPPFREAKLTPSPATSAKTGIAILDQCVLNYRLATDALATFRAGGARLSATREAFLQVRLLLAEDQNAAALTEFDASLLEWGLTVDELNADMPWARTRLWATRDYVEAGEHCYEVSPSLAERLSVTELHGVTGDSLRLPFDSIALVVPEELQDLAQVAFVALKLNDSARERGELISKQVFSIVAFRNDGTYTDAYSISPRLDSRDIRDALADSLRRLRNADPKTSLDEAKDRLTRLFWWVINVCIYSTHSGAEAEGRHPSAEAERAWQITENEVGPKRRQRLLNLYNAKFRQRIYLGRSVQSLGLKLGSRGPIGVRTLVAGHWRSQACGKARQDRRMTWIEPFWRGPREAPVSNPIRVISETRVL